MLQPRAFSVCEVDSKQPGLHTAATVHHVHHVHSVHNVHISLRRRRLAMLKASPADGAP